MAEVQRGEGPNALPFGAATALNRAQPSASAFQTDEIPIQFAPDTDADELPTGSLGENMDVLLSDPDEGYRERLMARDRPGRVPRYIVRHLPTLMAAARNPDAPPTIRAFYNAIVRQLEAEMRQGG